MKNAAFASALTVAVLLSAGAPQATFAQQGSIRGTVTNAQTGEPIVGAQVGIRGTSIGTITTDEGQFLITSAPAGRTELRVEFLG
jgi:hypothetical protein